MLFAKVVATSDGSLTLHHREHGEAYHSNDGAEREARDLYIEGSGIRAYWSDEKHSYCNVLDIGLGLGYNALNTIIAWLDASHPPRTNVISLENDRMLINALLSGKAEWQVNWDANRLRILHDVQQLSDTIWQCKIRHPRRDHELTWRIVLGEAHQAEIPLVEGVAGKYHFLWQDAFSPKTCPELWTETWFKRLTAISAPRAVLMTYSVARPVKDSLTSAGWVYSIIPTTTTKRSWLRAELQHEEK